MRPPPRGLTFRASRARPSGGLSAAEIDEAVRERTLRGEAIYELDREALARLAPT